MDCMTVPTQTSPRKVGGGNGLCWNTICRDIENTNYDEALLLEILSKFKLTSLVINFGNTNEDILNSLLQTHSIQKTLEHFSIYNLDVSKCTDVIKLFDEFKRIKTIKIIYHFPEDEDKNEEIKELKMKMKQLEDKMKQKHSEIKINISNFYRDS